MCCNSSASTAICCSFISRALVTESHSPIAIEQAPATSPANPVSRTVRQDELRTEAPRQPSQPAAAPARPRAGRIDPDPAQLPAPELGMRLFDRGEAPVDLRQMRVGFGFCEGAVKGGAVDLAAQVAPVAG